MAGMRIDVPSSLLLVHGAGSGPWIFEGWDASFPDIEVALADLHDGLDVARASMDDFAANVVERARALPPPVSLCGWSMGGLVVLQAATQASPHSVVLIEASPPAEVQGSDPTVPLVEGTFDPEGTYGHFPSGMQARPESLLARAERKRGIAVPRLPCKSLVVFGDDFRHERGKAIAQLYGSEDRDFPGLTHWDLVLDPRVRIAIAGFLGIGGQKAQGTS